MQKIIKCCTVLMKAVQFLLSVALVLFILADVWLLTDHYVFRSTNLSILGYSLEIVISGSMEPAVSTGDLILVKVQDQYDIHDIISYRDGDAIITHRIVQSSIEGFLTQGDSNNVPDHKLVQPDQIIGTVVLVLPSAGSLLLFLRTPLGVVSMVITGLLILLLSNIPSYGKLRNTS